MSEEDNKNNNTSNKNSDSNSNSSNIHVVNYPKIPESLKTPKKNLKKFIEHKEKDDSINNLTESENDLPSDIKFDSERTLPKEKITPIKKVLNINDINLKNLYSYRRPFSKFKRKLIFILIVLINILINFDHGAIPAGTTALKKENNLDNIQLGIIGSLVYLGLVLGSISAGYIFSNYSSKWVIILSLGFSCFFLYLFTLINGGMSMAFCRVGCGFSQVFCFIYFPIWVDQYGVNNHQTIWLTFLQLGVPIGTMLGYVLEALYIKYFDEWKIAFYTQIFFIVVCIFVLIITPDKFFSRNYRHSDTTQEEIQNEFNDLKELLTAKIQYNMTNNSRQSGGNDRYRLRNLAFINGIYENKYGRPSQYSIFSMIDETEEVSSEKYFIFLKELIKNKKYIFTMFGISCMLFIVTGIQFWISDYMQEVLGISRNYVYVIYSIICISAPTLGVLLGGFFIQYLGGYTNKRALDACFKIAILAALSGAFLPLFDVPWIFVISMWLLLFFGGSVTPGLTGIMIASIPESYKGLGNSLTQLCYNLIGYLPSPFIYGFVCKHTGGNKSRWGLAVLLLWAYFGVGSLYLARKFDNEKEEDIYELDENNNNIIGKRNSKSNEEIIDRDYNDNNNINEKNVNNDIEINLITKKSSRNVLRRQNTYIEKSNCITKLFGRSSAVAQ